jgi:hypothetical protein
LVDVDDNIIFGFLRQFVNLKVRIRHNGTVILTWILLSRHGIHLIAHISAKIFVFGTAVLVLAGLSFLMRECVLFETFFIDQEIQEL